jgi:putative two-component system response regulator
MSSSRRKIVAIVDDSPVILKAARDILKDAHDIFTMMSGEKLFQFLELSKQLPDMILLDVVMPPPDGYEVIGELKKNARFADIPVIFLTSKSEVESEIKGLSLGAVDYIAKPFSPPLLLKRLELQLTLLEQKQELRYLNANLNKLVQSKIRTIFGLQRTVLTTISDLVEFRDDVTGSHVDRTAGLLKLFVDELLGRNVCKETLEGLDVNLLGESSKLHDVGKIAIRDSILLKPGRLTEEEFAEMRNHSRIGEDIISRIQQESEESDFLNNAKIMAGAHHERWDGAGYPRRTAGDEIPLLGRLMAFADVYDALISKRPYKEPLPHERVLEIICAESGKQFDPFLMDSFAAAADRFHRQLSEAAGVEHYSGS